MVRSVRYLTRLMTQNRKWEIGPQGHALHALVLYDERVFEGGVQSAPRTDVASSAPVKSNRRDYKTSRTSEQTMTYPVPVNRSRVNQKASTATHSERRRWTIRWRDR